MCNKKIISIRHAAQSINASKTLVGEYKMGNLGALFFDQPQLAPDGKIYISAANTINYITVVNSPDSAGAACQFVDSGIHIPSIIDNLPYYPNYRLGVKTGGPCDTVYSNDGKQYALKIFPNPASDLITIDYGFTDWSKGPVSLQITNTIGLVLFTQPLPI